MAIDTTVDESMTREQWLRARIENVNSSESAALFGLGRADECTAFELANQKLDKDPRNWAGNERTEWGSLLESTIARRVAHVYGVSIAPMKNYMVKPGTRMGSSFDFQVTGVADGVAKDEILRLMFANYGPGIIEVKNVDSLIFRQQWRRDDDGAAAEAPDHIEVQVQHQMHVAEYGWTALSVLVGGNRLEMIPRLRDRNVGDAIEAKIAAFWRNLAADPPVLPPIELPADAGLIKKLYAYAEPGKLLDARGDAEILALCAAYTEAQDRFKAATDDKDTAVARLLIALGDHERALVDGFSVSATMVGPAEIPAYTRKGYRLCRITKKAAPKSK
jgi:predicted phage-related endonuclease